MMYALIFVASLLLEFVSTNWTKAVQHNRIYRATILSGIYHTINLSFVVVIVLDPILIIPTVIGRMAGVVVALNLHKK